MYYTFDELIFLPLIFFMDYLVFSMTRSCCVNRNNFAFCFLIPTRLFFLIIYARTFSTVLNGNVKRRLFGLPILEGKTSFFTFYYNVSCAFFIDAL